MIKTAAPAAALLALSALPALALDASKTQDIPAPPAKVWATIGDFCGIGQWHPAVERCTLSRRDGKPVRTLALKGGGTIVEEELRRDDAAMSYSYTILESPLPVTGYESTLAVKPAGGGSAVSWTGRFTAKGADDAAAKAAIQGIYDSGLAALATKAR
jgi:hypothetical protein